MLLPVAEYTPAAETAAPSTVQTYVISDADDDDVVQQSESMADEPFWGTAGGDNGDTVQPPPVDTVAGDSGSDGTVMMDDQFTAAAEIATADSSNKNKNVKSDHEHFAPKRRVRARSSSATPFSSA